MQKRINTLFLILLSVSSITSASYFRWLTDIYGKNSGHTVCNFLTIPVSAVNIARGKASSPGTMDAADLPLFTANSALLNQYMFSLSHTEWLFGLRKEYAGALFPVLEIGTYGFFTQVFTPGKIKNARDINEQPSDPKMVEFSAGATFARSFLNKKINTGLAVSYIESHLDHLTLRALNGSFDLLFILSPWISSRIYYTNFGPAVSYGTVKEHLPLETAVSLLFSPLPSNLYITSFFNFNIGIGLNKTADQPLIAGISTEIETAKYFYFRAGYDYNFGISPSLTGLGLGIGFHKGIYGIDAGWRSQSKEFGPVWSVSMKIQLEEIVPRTAKDYFEIALKHFRKKRYNLSTFYCKKAIRLDPNFWEAHTLIHRIHSEILRNEKKEIALIYTGNLGGHFTPSVKPDNYGGIARLATAVKSLRKSFPVSFCIESGNLLSLNPHPLKVDLAQSYYEHMKFDAIVVDGNQIDSGFNIRISESKTKISMIDNNNLQKDYAIIQKYKYRFFITSLPDKLFPNNLEQFEQLKLQSPQAQSCNLRIVVINNTWENIRKAASDLKSADIIICNNLDQHFASPMNIANKIILSCGSKGKYIGNLIMRFNNEKKLISAENKLTPITSDIQPDSVLKKLTDNIAVKIDLEKHGVSDFQFSPKNTDGVFIFQSDRDNYNGLYLKIPKKYAEFPLSPKNINCSNTSVSFVSSKVAYTESDAGCHTLVIQDLKDNQINILIDSIYANQTIFSPDGKWIYYAGSTCDKADSDIFKVRINGGLVVPIIRWKGSNEKSINFSHGTSLIVFCSDIDGVNQIFLTNLNGDDPIRITDAHGNHTFPAFSPDNKKIAYLSDRSNFGGKLDLWIFNRITSEHKQITSNSDISSFCWLSDSRTIIYSNRQKFNNLMKVDTKSYRFRKITNHKSSEKFYDSDPKVISFNKKEKILFTRKTSDNEKKIFWINTDGTGETCVVDSKKSDWQ